MMRLSADSMPVLFLLAAFLLSRIVYYQIFGLEFDASPIHSYWQYLDRDLLQNDLWQSLTHLHSQPPLFNLVLGILLKAFPASFPQASHGLFLLLGIGLMLASYGAMSTLGVNRWLSAGLAAAFVCMPSTVLYESWLFYTHPVSFLFALAICLAALFAKYGEAKHAIAFVTSLVALALLRAPFHLFWISMVAVVVVALAKNERKKVLWGIAPSFFILLLVHVNTWKKFSAFTLSESFANQSLSGLILSNVPIDELHRLKNEGKISELAFIGPSSPILEFRAIASEIGSAEHYNSPALTQVQKRVGGASNKNNASYLMVSRLQLRDAMTVLKERPGDYLKRVGTNIIEYSHPKERVNPFADPPNIGNRNLKRLSGPFAVTGPLAGFLPWLLSAALLTGLGHCLIAMRGRDCRRFFVVAFITGTIVLLSASYIFLAPRELCRYRAELDPGFLVLIGLAMQGSFNLLKKHTSLNLGRG